MDLISLLPLFALVYAAYGVATIVYRLYFSRISHIPGPRLAAISYFYQAYWDLWPHGGQFMFHCIDLHKQYGPIIRIGPDEVHINDPSFYNTCYPSTTSRPRDKSRLYFGWIEGTGGFSDGSSFATIPHDLHRRRRAGIAPFFSKKMVVELEPRVKNKVLLLREQMLKRANEGSDGTATIELSNAMSALTMDIISEYSFGRSTDALRQSDFGQRFNDCLRDALKMHPFGRAFPTIARSLLYIPNWLLGEKSLPRAMQAFTNVVEDLTKKTFEEAKMDNAKGTRTVLHTLIQNKEVPETERTLERIVGEALILFGAGTETTGRTLAVTLLNVLKNPSIYTRLLEEVQSLILSYDAPLPKVSQLEALPYLTAVISEGERITHGVAGRMARTAPNEDLIYPNGLHGPVVIPSGATFAQSNYIHHINEEIYPEPFEFRPDRFLLASDATPEQKEAVMNAKANLAAFGRGTRACPGLNLAYSEMYLTLAAMIGGLKLEVAEGVSKDAGKVTSEYFVGRMETEGKEIAVRVLGKI